MSPRSQPTYGAPVTTTGAPSHAVTNVTPHDWMQRMTYLVSILAHVLLAAGWSPFVVAHPHESFDVAEQTRQCVDVSAPDPLAGHASQRVLCTDGDTFGAWTR